MIFSKKQIVLVDPIWWVGHHRMYILYYARSLIELGWKLLFVVQRSQEFKELLIKEGIIDSESGIYECPPTPASHSIVNKMGVLLYLVKKLFFIIKLGAKLRQIGTKDSIVFFMWIDGLLIPKMPLFIFDFCIKFSWTGILFHANVFRGLLGDYKTSHKKGFSILSSKKCKGILTLDQGIEENLKVFFKGKKIAVVPDFTDQTPPDFENQLVRTIRMHAKSRKIVICTGGLLPYKGVVEFCKLVQQYPYDDCFFVMIGKLCLNDFNANDQDVIQQTLTLNDGRMFARVENYIESESVFNGIIAMCDILYMVYIDFMHSSNILTKAAFLEKPVICSSKYCIGEQVKEFRLGFTVNNPTDIIEIISALHQLLQNYDNVKESALFNKYREKNSFNRLQPALETILK